MAALRQARMTAEEFLDWSRRQPDRWELFDGEPVAMAPERVIHADTRYRAARAFEAVIAAAGVDCRFGLDSAAVRLRDDQRRVRQRFAAVDGN